MVSPSGQFVEAPPSTPATTPYSQPRLYYFISRSNGSFVPLVPADELPYSVRLTGIPRAIAFEQTCGMQHVGILPYTGQFFWLDDGSISRQSSPSLHMAGCSHGMTTSFSNGTAFLAPDAHLRSTANTSPRSTPTALPRRLISAAALATNWRNPIPGTPAPAVDPTQAFIDKIVASNAEAPARQGYPTSKPTPPLPNDPENKKKYCTYWLRTGNCDYQLTGCRYLHQMPDLPTLKEIGFRTVPRWWQEETAIKMGGSKVPTLTGKVVKSEEWLKRRNSAASDVEDESDADSAHDSKFDSDGSSSEANEQKSENNIKQTKTLAARMQTLPPITILKPSSMPSNDLIAFVPLIPTPPSSTPTTSTSSSPTQSPQPSTRKVFVPAGESADYHVEQARKTADAKRNKEVQPASKHRHIPDGHVAHRHATASLRDIELFPARTTSVGTARPAPRGLLASRHAPASAPTYHRSASPAAVGSSSSAKFSQTQTRRLSTTATETAGEKRPAAAERKCFPRVEGRVRRAVGFPAPAACSVGCKRGEKKEGKGAEEVKDKSEGKGRKRNGSE